MYIRRPFNHELNKRELEFFTAGLGTDGIITNETYYAKLGDYMKVKAHLGYENWSNHPATCIMVEIINTGIGVLDSQTFIFGNIWGDGETDHRYWLAEKGWCTTPTMDQKKKLTQEISNFVNVYTGGMQ